MYPSAVRFYVNTLGCTYTALGGVAYYVPGLHGAYIDYCSQVTNLHGVSLNSIINVADHDTLAFVYLNRF